MKPTEKAWGIDWSKIQEGYYHSGNIDPVYAETRGKAKSLLLVSGNHPPKATTAISGSKTCAPNILCKTPRNNCFHLTKSLIDMLKFELSTNMFSHCIHTFGVIVPRTMDCDQ